MPGEPEHDVDDRRVCAVCSNPLNYRALEGWMHPHALVPWDHPVVPVNPSDVASINWRCDFCTSETARWALPADNFQVPTGDMSIDDWCVCDTCKPAVEARDWLTIVDKVKERFLADGRPFGEEHTQYMLLLYALLERNITGPIYLNPPTRKEL